MRYRLTGFAFGFLAVVLAAWLFGRSRGTVHQRLLPEQAGRIVTVEFHYTRAAAPVSWAVLSAFFDQIAPDIEVVAACADPGDEKALRTIWRWHNPLRTVIVGAEITAWSKDRFLVGEGTPTELARPRQDLGAIRTRGNDALVAPALIAQMPGRFTLRDSDLAYDAGDILCTERRAIFSDQLASKNPAVKDIEKAVRELTGLAPLWLHGVPAHHIGMYAAPLSEDVAVVGDPDLGRRYWSPNATKKLGTPDFSKQATEPFRVAANELAQAGFRVVRVPACYFAPQVYVTYTNGIFETRNGDRIVYMPIYGIPSMDKAARAAYEKEGWDVRPIPVERIFRYRGTIGCLANVLARAR